MMWDAVFDFVTMLRNKDKLLPPRILCFALIASGLVKIVEAVHVHVITFLRSAFFFVVSLIDNERWTMHYVKNATAVTDVPMTLTDLMKQRRRW